MPDLETIWASTLEGAQARDYDRFVLETPSGHFAQTRAWAGVAEASRFRRARYFIAREAGRLVGSALVLRAGVGPVPLPAATVERGPVCARADLPRVLDALVTSARREGIVHLVVMPYWTNDAAGVVEEALRRARFRDAQRPDGAHAVTLRIAIQATSDEDLLAGGSRAQVRRLWREALRAGATVRQGTRADLDVHRALVSRRLVAERKRDRSSAWYDAVWAWLQSDAHGAFFVCEGPDGPVGTIITAHHARLATYAEGATTAVACPFSKSVLPLVASIRWARAQGCTEFDLGGFPLDEDKDPKRAAIGHYKLHFSRTRVRLVRAHARWF